MTAAMASPGSEAARWAAAKEAVARALARSPIIGVVRTDSLAEAERQARQFLAGGIELIEITFTVPEATSLVRSLLAERSGEGPHIGMGTVTTAGRAEAALEAGAEFVVSPNAAPQVASIVTAAGRFLVLGALTPTEVVAATEMGADLVKVYPLPPVGGPGYLAVLRQPLGDIEMLAAGGFGVEEISAYRAAGASAFGIGAPLLARTPDETKARIGEALRLARGGSA